VFLVLASITDSLVTFATNVISDLGLPGIFVLMAMTAAGIPIPSEATMLFAGFSVFQGHETLLGITVAGMAGDLAGCLVGYAIGHFARDDLLERHGAKIHLGPERMAKVDHWFGRYGSLFVFFSRMLPLVRSVMAIPAGAARFPLGRFCVLVLAGSLFFVLGFGLVGREVGHNWVHWKNSLHYVDYAVAAAIVAGIGYLVLRRRSGGGGDAPAADVAT